MNYVTSPSESHLSAAVTHPAPLDLHATVTSTSDHFHRDARDVFKDRLEAFRQGSLWESTGHLGNHAILIYICDQVIHTSYHWTNCVCTMIMGGVADIEHEKEQELHLMHYTERHGSVCASIPSMHSMKEQSQKEMLVEAHRTYGVSVCK